MRPLAAAALGLSLLAGPAQAQDCNGNGLEDAAELSMPVALHLDDTEDRVVASFPGFPEHMTVEMWLRITGAPHLGILSYATAQSDNDLLLFDASNLQVYIAGQSVSTGIDVADGQWHHLALVRKAGSGGTKVYVDAVLAWSGIIAPGLNPAPSGTLVLGEEQDPGGSFDPGQACFGMYRQVRIWSYTRTPSIVANDYDQPLLGNESGLVAYWPMDEGGGGIAADRAAGGHDFHLHNGPIWTEIDAARNGVLDECETPVHNLTQNTFHVSIQNALNLAIPFDEIVVQPGVYHETIDFVGKPVRLRSVDPLNPDVVLDTIIDARRSGPTVQAAAGELPGTTISGFVIAGGSSPLGGGMRINSRIDVERCVFTGNRAERGAGIHVAGGRPKILDCTFMGNAANLSGGAIEFPFGSDNILVENCQFCGNVPNNISNGFIDGGGNRWEHCLPMTGPAPTTGACCLSDACLIITAADCAAAGGAYQGDDTDCADVACPQSCAADLTGDDLVNVFDLLDLLGAWGACP